MVKFAQPIVNKTITPGERSDLDAIQSAEAVVDSIQEARDLEKYNETKGFITLARIISAAPVTGVYRIAVGKGLLNDYAILLNQSSGNRVHGQKDVPNFLPGTDVLVFIKGEDSDDLLPNIILGSTNVISLDPEKNHLFSKYSELTAKSGIDASLRVDQNEQILGENGNTLFLKDFSYGRPLDVIPGEWARINSVNGGFFLNDFMAFMKASEMSKIECFFFDNSIKMMWEKYSSQNAAFDERIFYDRYGISRIRGLASTLSEGLGSLQGNVALLDKTNSDPKSEQSRIWQINDAQRGLFTHQILEGSLIDGIYEFITLPPSGTVYSGNDIVSPGLLSIEKRLDGTFKLKAAKEVSIEKTMYIISPKEKADTDKQDNSKETSFERTPWTDEHATIEESAFLGKQVLDEYDEHDNTKNAFAGIHSKEAYWKLNGSKQKVYSDFNAATGASFNPEFTLENLSDKLPHYEKPPRKATVKPFANADGKREDEVEIFDISSAIRQLEDGSIVFVGGYGEEIRFFKGNIYLSCPGDIIEQPGRDKIAFAGRHNIQKADKGSAELTSNNSVTVAAAGNLQVTAAASGEKGVLLIENKSKEYANEKAFVKGGSLSLNTGAYGGIIIKSASNLAVMSRHNYIGYDGGSYADSITQINSGRVITNSHNWTSNIERGGVFSLVHLGGSVMTLASSSFEILTKNLNFGGSSVAFTKAVADFNACDYKGERSAVNISNGPPTLGVKGNASFNNITATSGLIDTVSTLSGAVGSQEGTGIPFGSNGYRSIINAVGSLAVAGSVTQNLFGIFKESIGGSLENLKKISTVMPSMSAYSTDNFYMPINTWQAILEGGYRWEEMEIPNSEDSTMAFPGEEIWNSGKGLKAYEDGEIADKDIKSEYVINTAIQQTGV